MLKNKKYTKKYQSAGPTDYQPYIDLYGNERPIITDTIPQYPAWKASVEKDVKTYPDNQDFQRIYDENGNIKGVKIGIEDQKRQNLLDSLDMVKYKTPENLLKAQKEALIKEAQRYKKEGVYNPYPRNYPKPIFKNGGKVKKYQFAGEAGSLLYLTDPKKIAEYNKKQVEKPDLYNTPTKQDNTNYNNYKPTNQTKVTQTPITFAGKQPVYVNNKGMNAGATIKPAEPKTAYNTYFNNPSVRSTGVIPTLATGIEVVGAMEGLGLAKQGLKKLGQYAEKKMLNYGRKSFTPDLTDVGKNLYNKGATPVSIKQALSEMDKAEARKMYERMYQRMLFDQRFATLPETTNKESLGVLNDFKKRVQTPEGKKRLKNLGIADDKSLQEMSILEDPNTFGYYTDAHNKIVMNPSSPLPRKVTRHEIEHGVQNAMRIKAYEDKINTLPSIKRIFTDFQDQKINRKLRTSNTKIDDLLTKLELRREGTPTIKWDTSLPSSNKPVNIDNYFNLIANKQNATDYFLTGSEGREKSAFLAEVQQYMMDKGVIPKTSYTNITPEMVEETMANALFDEESGKHLRLFNIMKASPNNYKLVADGLNKMLSTSPYIIPSAIGLSQQNNDNQIKYKQYKSKQ